MAKTLRTSGDYTIKAGDGFNSGSGTNTINLDSLNVSITGNLTVAGTSSTISTTNTIIEDNIIELQTGISASSNDSGIIIERGSTGDNAAIIWDESVDSFKLGTTTATGADKSGGITVTAGALGIGALTATTGTFSGAVSSVGHTVEGNITAGSVTTNEITANGSNADLSIQPSGTGDVLISALRVNGTTIDSSDSSAVQINENTEVDGTLTVTGAVAITSGTITGITDLAVADGGTGASSLTDNAVLTGTGTSAITAEGNLSFNGSTLAVTGAATVSTTLGVTGATTLSGGATILGTTTTGSLQTNEIAANGSNAALTVASSGTGDVTIDAGGDIILDADNADIKLKDGGTEFGRISRITSDLVIKSMGDNNDIILKGVDDSATINALTLDMSAAGAATFNSTVTATDITANSLTTNVISANGSNAGISIQPSGSGEVLLGALRLNGTTLDTDDSSAITIGEEINFQGAVNLLGGDLITGDNRISFNDQSSGTVSFLDFTVTQFSQNNNTVLSSVKSINFFLDSNGGDSGQAFRIYNNTNPDSSPTENTYIFKVAEDGDLFVTGDTSMTGTLTATDITGNSLTTNVISSNGSNADLNISASGTGDVAISSQLTLTGSFKPAIHTFTGTDAVTETEHAGRTLLLGEVGGNANVVLTLPDATGSGNIYHFIVSVAMGGSTTYKIQVPDADNTITGQIMYLDEDGTAVTSFPTVAASDTITLNSGTQGGLVGDTLTLIDIAADKYAVSGNMRVAAGANPATPFSEAVS